MRIMNHLKEFFGRILNQSDPINSDRNYYTRLYNRSLRDWLIYHQQSIVFNRVSWMGVRILKNPLDLWIYQELLYKVRPDVVVEIGSANGGSTLYIANILGLMGIDFRVISVDISRQSYSASHPRIIELTGDSLSSEIVNKVKELCAGKRVLIIHDADHTEESVYHNLIAYSSLVTVDSYFIVEDSIIDLFSSKEGIGGHNGPLRSIRKFLKSSDVFVVDSDCERYWITYCQRGFLRRVK